MLIQTAFNPRNVPPYAAIRTQRYRCEVTTDGSEVEGLYDLERDPWELRSKHADPAYARVKRILVAALGRLRLCQAASCHDSVPRLPEPGRGPSGTGP